MLSAELPPVAQADLSDSPPRESAVPSGWPEPIVPNFSDWQLGDIVLVGNDFTSAGNGIVLAQTASFSPVTRAGAFYTHAALYVGNGMLIDSTTTLGIAERSVLDYCRHRKLMVRRVPNLVPGRANNIVAKARTHLGKSYSWFGLIASKVIPQTVPDPDHLYCSTFVGLAVTQGSGRRLASQVRHKPLYPGTLAAHGGLDTIALEWRPV